MNGEQSRDSSESFDSFWLRELYPEASAAFVFEQASIESIKDTCFVVLDANVLLLPYRLGAGSLNDIKGLYGKLAIQDQIFLPAQAVREFLKNRAYKIRDVLRDLNKQASQIQIVADSKAGFLESDSDFQKLIDFSQKIKELKKSSLDTISSINQRLSNEIGADPVSSVYREVLSDKVVELDTGTCDDELKKDMAWRYRHSIPPGYKDRNKSDEGIGDFVIWKTILQIGIKSQRDCIFVTEDAKSDWWVQSEGVFQARLELVDEYRRASNGKTLHLIPFSRLLTIYGAATDTIDEARELEIFSQKRAIESVDDDRISLMQHQRPLGVSDIFEDDFDRIALSNELSKLSEQSHVSFKEKMNIDQALKNRDLLISMSDSEIAHMYKRRDELDKFRKHIYLQRRRLDDIMKKRYLSIDD